MDNEDPKFGTWYPASQIPPMRESYKGSPMTSGDMIVFNGHYVFTGAFEETYKKRERRWKGPYGVITVTHWMPFPPKPEAE